jgi:hypothetical protein
MTPVGFETTISTGERTQTYDLDRTATGTGYVHIASNILEERRNLLGK